MRAEKETQRQLFFHQRSVQIPSRHFSQFDVDHIIAVVTKQGNLIGTAFGLLGRFNSRRKRCDQGGAVRFDQIKRTCANQRLDAAAIDRVTIDATTEIEQRGKGSALARADNFFDRALPSPFDRAQAVTDRAGWQTFCHVFVRNGLKSET